MHYLFEIIFSQTHDVEKSPLVPQLVTLEEPARATKSLLPVKEMLRGSERPSA